MKYTPIFRLPEFLLGVATGLLFTRLGPLGHRPAAWLTAGAGGMLLVVLGLSRHVPFHLLHNGLLSPLYAALIVGLASGGPFGRLLRLRLPVLLGEASYALYLLQAPLWDVAAIGLFTERAAAASGHFELTASNRAAVTDLCHRLDGLPLAIELAAVRTRVLAVEQILDRLGDRFGLLTGGGRAVLPRHQTLRTTIDWSHDLLAAGERVLLRRLCVFAGRFALEDVEGVCALDDVPGARALDLLSSLVARSLVTKEEARGFACYRLHETMREYARLRLREAGEEEEVELRCADHYRSRCRRSAQEARHRLVEWLEWDGAGDRQRPVGAPVVPGPRRRRPRGRPRHLPRLVLDHARDHRGRAVARRAARLRTWQSGGARPRFLRSWVPGRAPVRSDSRQAGAGTGGSGGPGGGTARPAVAIAVHGIDRREHGR